MSSGTDQIEQIVAEVLRRLAVGGRAPAAVVCAAPEAPDASGPAAPPSGDPRELVLADRVITLQTIHGRLDGVRRLVLHPAAVLTPSVRDELRRRGVAVRADGGSPRPAGAGCELVVAFQREDTAALPAVQALAGQGLRVREVVEPSLAAAVARAAAAVEQGGCLGVVLTRQPALAVRLAHRSAEVRAAWAVDAPSVNQALEDLDANLLVLAAPRHNRFELVSLISRFVAGGGRASARPAAAGAPRPSHEKKT